METRPIRFRCGTCRGPVRYVLDAPYRLELDNGDAPRNATGPAIFTGPAELPLIHAMMPNECEACRLARATDNRKRDALTTRLAELESVAASVGLPPSLPFTMHMEWTELRADRAELAGFTVVSYGLWHTAPPRYTEFTMHHMYVCLGDMDRFLVLYPLDVISHPDIPAELHVRWSPETGREWTEIENERGTSIEQLKRLMDGLSLYREQRPLGRRQGRKHSRSDVLDAYVGFFRSNGWYPDQTELATEMGQSPKTVRRILSDGGEEWLDFEAAARRHLISET